MYVYMYTHIYIYIYISAPTRPSDAHDTIRHTLAYTYTHLPSPDLFIRAPTQPTPRQAVQKSSHAPGRKPTRVAAHRDGVQEAAGCCDR